MRDNLIKYEFKQIIKSTQLGTDLIGSENNSGIPLLKMGNLTVGGFSFKKLEKLKISEPEEVEKFVLYKGDFLFNTRNTLELVGKSAVWNNALSLATFNSNIMRIKFKQDLADDFYLGYYFSMGDGWSKFKRITTGTTSVAAIYSKDLFKCIIKLPPLPQQKKIAKILSTVDTVIEQTETAIAKYQAIKQGLMHDLFTRGIDVNTGLLRPTAEEAPALYKESSLGLIPKDWEEITFGYEINFLSGCPFSSAFFNEEKRGLPLIRIRDLINSSQETYYNGAYSDSYLINEGDVLIGMDGDFHIVKWNNSASLLNQRILKISEKRDGKLYLDYFFYYLFPFLLDVHNKTAATTVKHLSTKDISDAKRFMPLKPEQILSAKKILSVDQKIQTEQQALAKYQQLKAGLLQDLLTGKVEVTVD